MTQISTDYFGVNQGTTYLSQQVVIYIICYDIMVYNEVEVEFVGCQV